MNHTDKKIGRAQQERLNYIEKQLLWMRRYTSNMLVKQFGISKALAHKDMALYKKLFPKNIAPFDPKKGFLTPATNFACQLIDPCRPPADLVTQVPTLEKTTNSKIVEQILKAIDQSRSIEVNYVSSSKPAGKKRLITPSRIVNASNRLHFRGYCHLKSSYRDFVIARCLTLPKLKVNPCDIPDDIDFKTNIDVKLKVNNALCEDGYRLVTNEYREELSQKHQLPRALFYYFLIDNNLPVTQEQKELAQRLPWVYPLLANIEEGQQDSFFGDKLSLKPVCQIKLSTDT